MKDYDVVILGAGAAGLICASTAARRGRRVLLLEKSNRAGKKILMSGGGRCNFTNQIVEADNFISSNAHFSKAALHRYTQWDFISMVDRYGIEYEERKHSQLFCKGSSKQILAMLLEECRLTGVEIEVDSDVKHITTLNDPTGVQIKNPDSKGHEHYRYQLSLTQGAGVSKKGLRCQSLVVATGALSVPSLGGSGMGYEIARQFNLQVTERRAGLVPFMFSDSIKSICERLSGVALEVELECNDQVFAESMLFTHRGLSGPVILQISNYWHPGDEIIINLLPGVDVSEWLLRAKQETGRKRVQTVLNRKMPKSLVNELQQRWWPGSGDSPVAEFSNKQLMAIGQQINHWHLKPSATEGYRTAEVTLGGVSTDGLSSKTMEVRKQAGLYFVGEVLDVSGHLGGFNFQWAWSSGYSAGLVA